MSFCFIGLLLLKFKAENKFNVKLYARLQTEHELEKLRSDSKESYERENRGLREARDLAVQERNQVQKTI